jgi:hypothetical protein
MDLDRFLDELKLSSEYFCWDDACKWGQWPIQIRGVHKNGRRYCPITAVAFVTLGLDYTVEQWPNAAIALGVSDEIASDIMVAADGGIAEFSEYDMLYELLLDTVGLTD